MEFFCIGTVPMLVLCRVVLCCVGAMPVLVLGPCWCRVMLVLCHVGAVPCWCCAMLVLGLCWCYNCDLVTDFKSLSIL